MKYKYMVIALGLVIATASLTGCASTNTEDTSVMQENTAEDTNADATYGEVVSIDSEKITIEVGTRKEMNGGGKMPENGERPEGEGAENNAAGSGGESDSAADEATTAGAAPADMAGERPSMLDLSGEEMEIRITDATVITRQGMGEGGAPGQGVSEEITLEDIAEGDVVSVTFAEEGNAATVTVMSMGMGGGGGGMPQTSGVDEYKAVTEYAEDAEVEGETFTSTGADENAIHVLDNANVSLNNIEVIRSSSDSTGGDSSSFYGVGAALLDTAGTTYLQNSIINTDAAGGAGVFAYGDGVVYVADSTITTEKDTSGGIHAAGGGTLYAWNLNVNTEGESSAAIRSDRGGGTMVVDSGSYTSNGTGSPAVYCTADIAVKDASLTAAGSEAVCIEGLNSLRLYNSNLTGNMSEDNRNDCTWNVILYQSMSGDSEVGNSTFQMDGGTLTAQNGGMFYTTNTESTITLSDVDINYADDNDFFLRCSGNNNERGWGQTGNNGSDCLFTASGQAMAGDVIWDSISNLDFYMTEGSTLEGAFVQDETYAGEGGDGYANVWISEDSTWTVTGDSTLSALHNAGTIVDESGNAVTVKGSDGTVYVEGTSEYTITVDAYEADADVSGASAKSEWSEYAADRPEALL